MNLIFDENAKYDVYRDRYRLGQAEWYHIVYWKMQIHSFSISIHIHMCVNQTHLSHLMPKKNTPIDFVFI